MWKSDLPYEITAGTTIKWVDESTTRGLNQVISSPDWTLKYYLRTNKLGGAYTATGTQYQSSTGWEFTISASDTGSLEPGEDLDECTAAIRAIVKDKAAEYSIGNRTFKRVNLKELRDREAELKARVFSEKRYDLKAQGLGDPKNLYVSF